jgi:HAD superfamily phosphoserine phosphatase-like hydrolase
VSLVLVDLDGTLLQGISSERLFFIELLQRGKLGPRQLAGFLVFGCRWMTRYRCDVWKKNKAYLDGLAVEAVGRWATDFAARRLRPRIRPKMKDRIERHHRDGDETVLLTGSPDFIAQPLAAWLGMHHVRGTSCARRGGRYSAAPPLTHPRGAEKLALALRLCRRLGYRLSDCTAYGDDAADVALLDAVARPVAVHPVPGLRRIAVRKAWPILE